MEDKSIKNEKNESLQVYEKRDRVQSVSSGGFVVTEKMTHLSKKLKHLVEIDVFSGDLDSNFDLDDDNLDDVLGVGGTKYFLGDPEYTTEAVMKGLESHGVTQSLAQRGYHHPYVSFDVSDPYVHKLFLHDESLRDRNEESSFLMAMFVRRKDMNISQYANKQSAPAEAAQKHMRKYLWDGMKMTVIEWLTMQDPKLDFTGPRENRQLPGQRHPGLHIAREILGILEELCIKKGRDAILNIPEYFHNAYLYNMKDFRFINPHFQAVFNSISKGVLGEIKEHGLGKTSWAIEQGLLVNKTTNLPFKWEPEEQVLPISKKMKGYFNKQYDSVVENATDEFFIDWNLPTMFTKNIGHDSKDAVDSNEVSNG